MRGSVQRNVRPAMPFFLFLLGLALQCSANTPTQFNKCAYGSAPGHIVISVTNKFPLQWEPIDPKCQMTDELSKYTGHDPSPEGIAARDAKDVTVLSYGDPADGMIVKDICELATQAGVNAKLDVSAGKDAPTCTVPGLKMINQIIPSVQETGPYIMGFTDEDEPAKSIPKGLERFQQLAGSKKPDVVIFSSLLLEMRRMAEFNKDELKSEFLGVETVQRFMNRTLALLTKIEGMFDNDTLLVYHNAAYPALADCKLGSDHAQPSGKRTHIIQLNKAATFVISLRPRWQLVDFDQMSMPFSLTGIHLRDGLHPGPVFLMQVFNIYLNLYKEHQIELGKLPAPQTQVDASVAMRAQSNVVLHGMVGKRRLGSPAEDPDLEKLITDSKTLMGGMQNGTSRHR